MAVVVKNASVTIVLLLQWLSPALQLLYLYHDAFLIHIKCVHQLLPFITILLPFRAVNFEIPMRLHFFSSRSQSNDTQFQYVYGMTGFGIADFLLQCLDLGRGVFYQKQMLNISFIIKSDDRSRCLAGLGLLVDPIVQTLAIPV